MAADRITFSLRDLLDRGYLSAEDELTCVPLRGAKVHVASLDAEGRILYGNDAYKTPSGWASALAGGKSRNGWEYVRRKRDDRSLKSIHDDAMQEVPESRPSGSSGRSGQSPGPDEPIPDSGVVPVRPPLEGEVEPARLLDRIKQLSPAVFEKLVGEFLKAKGFENVEVTGRAYDGGIDGHCYLSFLDINVGFQAKRWSSNVPVEDLQRLVGSISGKFERGVFVTTSDYTLAAQNWMSEGKRPIVALNGVLFAKELLDLGLGVVRIPLVERRLDEEFFESLDR